MTWPDWNLDLLTALGREPTTLLGGQSVNRLPQHPFSDARPLVLDAAYRWQNRNPCP